MRMVSNEIAAHQQVSFCTHGIGRLPWGSTESRLSMVTSQTPIAEEIDKLEQGGLKSLLLRILHEHAAPKSGVLSPGNDSDSWDSTVDAVMTVRCAEAVVEQWLRRVIETVNRQR